MHEHDTPSSFQPGFSAECMACPICLFFYAMKTTKPDVMDHMMKAAFEMFQAFQSVMDSYGRRWEQSKTLERIPIG